MSGLKAESVRKATFVVMITLLLSRVFGLLRYTIASYIFGMGNLTDAFNIAFTIPDAMFDLLISGALSAGFMPVFGAYVGTDKEKEGWESSNVFISFALVFVLIFIVLGTIFTKYLIPLVGVGMMKDKVNLNLTINLTRLMFPAVMFTVLAGILRGILNTYKRFTVSSFGPVAYNVGIIIGAILLGKAFGIYGMAIGVLAGGIFNFLIQLPEFLKLGKGKLKISLNAKNSGFRRMLMLMGPTVLGLSILRINVMINANIASVLGQGSVTAVNLAQRIMMLPLGIFGASISTTVFPALNSYISTKNYQRYRNTLISGVKMLMFLTIPCAVGILALDAPIIRLLFKSGKFTEESVRYTAVALAFYTPGIVAQACVPTLIRGFYSIQDTKTPLKTGAVAAFLNIALNLMFLKFSSFAVAGIALSSSATSTLEMLLLFKLLNNKVRLGLRELIPGTVKSLVSSVVMGILVFALYIKLESLLGISSKMHQLTAVSISMLAGVLIYGTAAYLLKIKEFDYCLNLVKGRLHFRRS